MSRWSINGESGLPDVKSERIAHGTVGGQHITPSSVGSNNMSRLIAPSDARVLTSGTWLLKELSSSAATDFLGVSLQTSTANSQVQVAFSGTQIAIIGQVGPSGGTANVYIDGVLAKGKVNTYSALAVTYFNGAGGTMNATDTTVASGAVSLSATGFTSSGTIQIDGEQMTYSGLSGFNFTGVTRGVNGTTATTHAANTPIYQVNSTINLNNSVYMDRVRLWSIDNLAPGNHTLTIVNNSGLLYISGFSQGGVLGAANINTYIDYFNIGSVAINGFGYSLQQGLPGASTSDRQVLCFLPGSCDQGVLVLPILNQNNLAEGYTPTTDRLVIYSTKVSSTLTNVIIPTLMLGPSF